jgi:IS30 family transposase
LTEKNYQITKKHPAPYTHIFADKAGHIVNANQVSIVEYIKNRISIKQRPLEIKKCERFGDLEVDLIIGKNHEQAIVTINDRASGMLKMKKIPSKEAKVVQKTITELLED